MIVVKEKVSSRRDMNHLIYSDNPIDTSRAAFILLKELYISLDEDYRYQTEWHYLFITKRHWLRKKRKENGGYWVCHYCGDKVYKMVKRNHQYQNTSNCITIDHKVPKSQYKDATDTKNFLECCDKCNQEKSDISYDKFVKLKKNGKIKINI